MRYAAKRIYAWSSNIAYTVGLMASDGCLQSDGRHLDLTSVDIDQLENFILALGRHIRITKKQSSLTESAYRVQFSDVAYYDFLLDAGLTPTKSKSIGSLSIPNMYFANFLRGVFDGDGSCYAYMDKRWKSSHMFYVTLTSASPIFLEYLRTQCTKLFGTSNGSLRLSGRAHILSYAKADARLIFTAMYSPRDAIYLNRKFMKLHGFTEFKNNGKISQV